MEPYGNGPSVINNQSWVETTGGKAGAHAEEAGQAQGWGPSSPLLRCHWLYPIVHFIFLIRTTPPTLYF